MKLKPIDIERQRKIDYGWTFGTEQGKQVLYDLACRFHVFTAIITPDALTQAFLEGQRSVILDIIEKAATDYDERKRQILEEMSNAR